MLFLLVQSADKTINTSFKWRSVSMGGESHDAESVVEVDSVSMGGESHNAGSVVEVHSVSMGG